MVHGDREPFGADDGNNEETGGDKADSVEGTPGGRAVEKHRDDAPGGGAGEEGGEVGEVERGEVGVAIPDRDGFRPITHEEGEGKDVDGNGVDGQLVEGQAEDADGMAEAVHYFEKERGEEERRGKVCCEPTEKRLDGAARERNTDGKECQAKGCGNGERRVGAQDLVDGEEEDDYRAAQDFAVEDAEREPWQCALVPKEIDPTAARHQDKGAEDKAHGIKNEIDVRNLKIKFLAQDIGQGGEARGGEQKEQESADIQNPESRHGVGQKSRKEIKGMPVGIADVPGQIVVPAEEVFGEKGRVAAFHVSAHARENGQKGREIIVGEEEAGAPELEEAKNDEASAHRPSQQDAQARSAGR